MFLSLKLKDKNLKLISSLCCKVIVKIVKIKDSCDQQSCFKSMDNIAPVGFCHFVKEVK